MRSFFAERATGAAALRFHTALRDQNTQTHTKPLNTGLSDDDFVHTVSTFQWFLDMVLRVKVPRSLCGVLLVADPDKPEPTTPCPACAISE